MDITIREMLKEDWCDVAQIFQEGIDMKTATFHTHVPSYDEWDASHTKNCRLVVVADNKVIAWAALSPYSNRPVYSGVGVVSIYVRSGYRGMHVGEKLLKALIDESEKEGYWTLQSNIFETNVSSIALHQKVGFRMVGYRERIGKDSHGTWLNTVIMERRSNIVGID